MLINAVAPFAGAWIEIQQKNYTTNLLHVAPFAGAWIEIITSSGKIIDILVAPFAGAWIEIVILCIVRVLCKSRSLRGSVD